MNYSLENEQLLKDNFGSIANQLGLQIQGFEYQLALETLNSIERKA